MGLTPDREDIMSWISFGSNRRGATLPLTVLVLALMAVAVTITYARVSTERVIGADSKAQFGAFAVAQSGLNRYLANLNGKPAGLGPWNATYVDLPGGTARVDMVMLRDSTSALLPAVYAITSRGRYTAARRFNSLTPSAERTVATYALWTPAPIDVNAGVTSLTGMTANGNSGAYSGIDRCGTAAPIPGVAVPDGLWNAAHPNIIDGSPDNAPVGMGTPGPAGTARNEVDIDWPGIVAWPNSSIMPDLVYNGANWPLDFSNWPVIRVNGDAAMPGSGKGILIVTGNLTWNGTPNKQWEGLILVGGTLIGNGASTIYGAVVTGLNVKLGINVPNYDVGNGTKTWQYDSCSLARALGHIGSIQRVRNAWTDTWPSY
jgi:hypothetical protein